MTEQSINRAQSVVDFRVERLRRSLKNGPSLAALAVAEKYATDGLAEAQYLLGQMLAESEHPGDVEAAERWYEAAARQGHVQACKALWRATTVNGGAEATRQAHEFMMQAADLGDLQASAVLILLYFYYPNVQVPNMQTYLRRHADRGHDYAQLRLAQGYASGSHGLSCDSQMAFEYFRLAAEQGHAYAQCCVGICYAYGRGVQQDDEQAVYWYLEAAKRGSVQAQHNIGYSFENGRKPLKKSMREANRWFRRAALRDFDLAQYSLGMSYLLGRELPQNSELANRWFARAAQQGCSIAQVALGYSYENGRGVERSYSKALELYKAAADAGYAQGQHNYAHMMQNGFGTEKNLQEAARWYAAASEQGLACAQENLALMYATGAGIEKNLEKALNLYQRAATQNREKAIKGVEWMTHEMAVVDARNALSALADRLASHDPDFQAKKAILVPILKPILELMPPSNWAEAFERAYAAVRLPAVREVPSGEGIPRHENWLRFLGWFSRLR